MKTVMVVLVMIALISGVANSAPISGMAAKYDKETLGGTTNIGGFAQSIGLTWSSHDLVSEMKKSNWDEISIIEAIIAKEEPRLPTFLNYINTQKIQLTEDGQNKIINYTLNAAINPVMQNAENIRYCVQAIPVNKRQALTNLISLCAKRAYPDQPVRASVFEKIMIKYEDGGDFAKYIKDVSVEDLVALRLAPELRSEDLASLILDKATVAAKKKLRADGKSFVVKNVTTQEVVNGVTKEITKVINPLSEKIQPIVDALNSPLSKGIEEALSGCGLVVKNQDSTRSLLSQKAKEWEALVLDGEIEPHYQQPYLNALKVALGVDGYNKMIDVYNNGTK